MYSVAQEKRAGPDTGGEVRKLLGICALLLATAQAGVVAAQGLQALARLEVADSAVSGRPSGDVDIRLKLTQAVPWRVFTLAAPPRLVIDFREVAFAGLGYGDLVTTGLVTDLRTGLFRPGWSRMVLALKRPMRVFSAAMETDADTGAALIRMRLTPQDPEDFAAASGTPPGAFAGLPEVAETPPPKRRPTGERPVVVALDPGHGGIDPGAQYGGRNEADLMLQLAREMKESLVRTGRYEVFLTRREDVFLSLQGRITAARAGGADVFLSLHADALSAGRATGTTVYTLSGIASDSVARALAESHERGDLLAGVDLSEQDDEVAEILIDMARTETTPRSERLADSVVAGIAESTGQMRARPRLSAGFSVLKAPDIPSVLIEFGFMSNPSDLVNLANPAWRAQVIAGITAALDRWSLADAAEARLLRQ